MADTVIAPLPVPLTRDDTGTWRVGGTRIPLERVIEAYKDGAPPETIVRWFDSLRLADVYAVLSYYLNHPQDVEEYMRARDAAAAEIRRKIEAGQSPRPGMRDELLARQRSAQGHPGTEAGDAPAGQ